MRGQGAHVWMCVAVIVLGTGAVLVTGSSLYLLPVLGCLLMMGTMMWLMMRGMAGRNGGSDRSDRS